MEARSLWLIGLSLYTASLSCWSGLGGRIEKEERVSSLTPGSARASWETASCMSAPGRSGPQVSLCPGLVEFQPNVVYP